MSRNIGYTYQDTLQLTPEVIEELKVAINSNYVRRFAQGLFLTEWKISHNITPPPGYPPESWQLSLYLEPHLNRDVASHATYLYADEKFLYMRWSAPVKGEIGVLILNGKT